jgi:hypothetical protein
LPYHIENTPSTFAFGDSVHLLRAPDRGRGEVLVEPGLEHDLVALQVLARLPQRLVEAAERRAAVTGHEAGGVQAGPPVALALQHRQPHQRLRARHERPPALERVLVVERDLAQRAEGAKRNSGVRTPQCAARHGRSRIDSRAGIAPTGS